MGAHSRRERTGACSLSRRAELVHLEGSSMASTNAWMIGDNACLVAELRDLLDEDAGISLTGYPLSAWQDQRLPRGTAQCVFVDLRGPELWSYLREMRDSW